MLIFKRTKLVDLVNVSGVCKRFFLISKVHKKFRETITFSKSIINFDDYYTEFLEQQLLHLEPALYKKFNEELSSDVFSIIGVKMKKVSYEPTPFRVFCHCFFCTTGSRSFDGCSISSRIFVNNNYAAKKIDSAFVITRNSIKNLEVFLSIKYLNTQCVVLNIYYMVGIFVYWTENFNEVFCEIAGGSFGV